MRGLIFHDLFGSPAGMPPTLFLIVNPVAGRARAMKFLPAVANYFDRQELEVDIAESKAPEDIRHLASLAADRGFQYVLGLGGDGTFRQVVEGIRTKPAIAGFLPAGNGNDIARALGIPPDPVRAADAFLRSYPRPIDLVRVRSSLGESFYACAGGVGLDAEAAHLANTRFRKMPGATRYLAGALWAFVAGRTAFQLDAQIDGVRWSGRAILAVVANAPWYGSGLCIAPRARLDDGWLEVVLVRELPFPRLLEAIPILLASGDLRFREVERFRCRRAVFQTDRPMKVHGDGELLGDSPVEFQVVPQAVRVMTPVRPLGPSAQESVSP